MKKIFSILAAVLFVSSLSAKTIYCKADQAWWTEANGGVACYAWSEGGAEKNAAWPGVRMEAVEGEKNVWKIDLDAKFIQCNFVRVNATGEAVSDWGAKTKDQTIPTDDKDLATITNETAVWGDPGCEVEWSKYEVSGEPEDAYYLKNGWNGESEWTWKKMTKDGDNYKLENVVFGGSGVNYNSKSSDTGSKWVELKDFQGDKIGAFDTVSFVLAPATGTITATLLGKYVAPADPDYYMKNGWNGGAWEWKKMTKVGDGTHKLENVVFGGEGVNYNKVSADAESEWVAADAFKGDKVEKLDTVTLVLDPAKKEVTATLIGKYVAPEFPVVAVAGAFNDWSDKANVMVQADDKKTASVKINLTTQDYQFKMVVGGTWLCPQEGLYELKRDYTSVSHVNYGGGNNDNFVLKCDAAGEYTFTWTYADSTLTVTFPAKGEDPGTKLANGYYLIGDKYDWSASKLTAAQLFAQTEQEGEYKLEITLTEGEKIKVAKVEADATVAWYPNSEYNYTVDAAHAGSMTIYFRPAGNAEEWAAFGGYMYIEVKEVTAISNTAVEAKAVKAVVNGMLVIEKAGVRYNVMGQIVK